MLAHAPVHRDVATAHGRAVVVHLFDQLVRRHRFRDGRDFFSHALPLSQRNGSVARIGPLLAQEGRPVHGELGFEIIPRLSTFYPKQLSSIPVYFEIYNSSLLEDSVFGVKQTVVDAATSKEIEGLTLFTRHDAAEVVPILREIDISLVETGKYLLNFTHTS